MNEKLRMPAVLVLAVVVAIAMAGCAVSEPEPETGDAAVAPTLESLGATATVVEYLTSNDIEMITYLTAPELRSRVVPQQATSGPDTLVVEGWYPEDADRTGNLARSFAVELNRDGLPYNVVIERASPNDPWRVIGEGRGP